MAITENHRIALALASNKAERAVELLRTAEHDLNASGLFGVGGDARQAIRKVEKLLKRCASVSKVEG